MIGDRELIFILLICTLLLLEFLITPGDSATTLRIIHPNGGGGNSVTSGGARDKSNSTQVGSTNCSSRFRSCGCEKLPREHPQCGNDGVTYWNSCEIECQRHFCVPGVQMLRNGTCDIRPESRCCQFKCPIEELNFICGSDGKTYGNECEFRCESKCKPGLAFKRCGSCRFSSKITDCIAPSTIKFGG